MKRFVEGPISSRWAGDRASLPPMAENAKEALGVDELEVAADRSYFSSEQILECSRARMGATNLLMKRLKNVRTEMALSVLAYNFARVMNILGTGPLIQALRA